MDVFIDLYSVQLLFYDSNDPLTYLIEITNYVLFVSLLSPISFQLPKLTEEGSTFTLIGTLNESWISVPYSKGSKRKQELHSLVVFLKDIRLILSFSLLV